MMIKIAIPMKQDFVIEVLEATEQFKLESKTGINLVFSTTIEDQEEAIKLAKATIKATPTGSVLYFNVTGA